MTAEVDIEVLTPAFTCRSDGNLQNTLSTCKQYLGLAPSHGLKLFQLVPLSDETKITDCGRRFALQIQGSSLTLPNIENTLKDKETIRTALRRAGEELAALSGQVKEYERALKEFQSRGQHPHPPPIEPGHVMNGEIASLRTQLSDLERRRSQSQQAAQSLKREFDDLYEEISTDLNRTESSQTATDFQRSDSNSNSNSTTTSSSRGERERSPKLTRLSSRDTLGDHDSSSKSSASSSPDPYMLQLVTRLCSDD
eukprot:CAMPEP_0184650722 /NCGR_PEP_ID=MMETSP0308-20130426/8302_1 /TAXON_ID=38269 /ORGANISM="Gloeochaete witrockiana, Strain SAG 46.84" /LENGTH=253 /DNA_ID=CAMNT_0027084481 /DNA_START=167 /DNA_END=925 /DNA_ORIENTATION=-